MPNQLNAIQITQISAKLRLFLPRLVAYTSFLWKTLLVYNFFFEIMLPVIFSSQDGDECKAMTSLGQVFKLKINIMHNKIRNIVRTRCYSR